VASIRSKSHFRSTPVRIWPVVLVIVALVLVAGGIALAVFEPRPAIQHFEVTVPSDRFAR
jgi:hypothetical protein